MSAKLCTSAFPRSPRVENPPDSGPHVPDKQRLHSEQDGTTGQAGFDGVQGGFGFAFGSRWAGAFLGVGAIGTAACVGDGTLGFGSGQLGRSGRI